MALENWWTGRRQCLRKDPPSLNSPYYELQFRLFELMIRVCNLA